MPNCGDREFCGVACESFSYEDSRFKLGIVLGEETLKRHDIFLITGTK